MSRRRILLVIGCLLMTSPVLARDLIVDNLRGSDSQNDRGFVPGPATFGPYRTINRALAGARSGDRIVLTNTGEPYREMIALNGYRHSGSPGAPFEIVGNGATLDGTVAAGMERWRAVGGGVWQLEPTPPGYPLLSRGGRPLNRVEIIAGGDLQQLQPLSWARAGALIYFRGEPHRGPFDYPLEVTELTTGITLYDVHDVVIRDLVVRGYRLDGINAHDRVRETAIVGVASRHNGRSGITVAGASQVTIGATLCEQNGKAQLRVEGRGVARLGNVDLVAGTDPAPFSAPALVTEDAGQALELPRQ
ncbi:hypothetical protein [Candidatus Laterigemmans baculatus]|uniref:hypothetical protein n=1 Tax=Candidatus Laterigemmans baculatus TaxID=2770505 RepID=UPI0013DD4A43|nr:hypothetical protein [Candidatus Laterigemmans baculatus]